jgi:hypothetical protein
MLVAQLAFLQELELSLLLVGGMCEEVLQTRLFQRQETTSSESERFALLNHDLQNGMNATGDRLTKAD